ncbi:hypothetical protein RO3G_13313 [Rhizopus delemar RA 99-880]|uniref:Uncharacterized protein n=1 Tax=Rhizopus delemar (strain RA 99-880 / ATCC MYA-4621 / FGSC 9543 / NRRL 43880) TaxID=246409 RepID=I1CJH2_RHIO9|nr:hypothetical protein RO3G_13313 [Rhizopus delemar RA 99-880]|eukprot:EIE88602.1 hypothetical protein RO3G_13313 [Rhizopus delemar RA 99-880]
MQVESFSIKLTTIVLAEELCCFRKGQRTKIYRLAVPLLTGPPPPPLFGNCHCFSSIKARCQFIYNLQIGIVVPSITMTMDFLVVLLGRLPNWYNST